jgi:bifunctional ADP-heptose synthase (sugar kinase/adenylyltransferase)
MLAFDTTIVFVRSTPTTVIAGLDPAIPVKRASCPQIEITGSRRFAPAR